MSQRTASILAILFCAAVLAVVALFGYGRYREQQRENAAFSHALNISAQQQTGALKARMPPQLAPHTSSVSAAGTSPEEGVQH